MSMASLVRAVEGIPWREALEVRHDVRWDERVAHDVLGVLLVVLVVRVRLQEHIQV